MRIEFSMEDLGTEDTDMFIDFCRYLLGLIREDVTRQGLTERVKTREHALINSGVVDWIKTPNRVDMKKLVKFISNHIVCTIREKSACVISINQDIKMPDSTTPLSVVVRYLDKGNFESIGTSFIGKIFTKYSRGIYDYWDDFIEIKGYRDSIAKVETII